MSRSVPEMTGAGRLYFAVLGSFRVDRDGQQVDLGPRLQRALLAILVLEAGHVVPVDRLVGLLWWQEPPAAALASVQAYVSQLRRVLEPGRAARAPTRVLVTQDRGYLLRAADDQVDALRFGALARQAHGDLEAGRPVAAAGVLADALALWRGDPLAEFAAEPWAVPAVTRLNEAHDLAEEDRIDAALALGGHAQAAAELEAMVAARPLRERRWAQLIVAAYRCGRQADALRAYQRCRAVLAGELGLEPGPGLRRLEAAVLAQDASLDWHPVAARGVVTPPDAMSGDAEAQRAGPQRTVGPSAPSVAPRDAELPTGTVTFLLTAIEDSTGLWETEPDAMEAALEQHNRLLSSVIAGHGGVVVASRGEGDGFVAAFPSAVSAVEAAGACQLQLQGAEWPAGPALRVCMGLHTGEARVRDGDYVDHAPINRCARVRGAAHGGQVLVTKATRDLADGRLGGGFALKRLGEFRLRGRAEPELIYQLTHADLPADYPRLATVAELTGNLPVPVSSFIGRAKELEQAWAALGQGRVVTLTGPGGVGKTRLALQAAAQVAPWFGDGAWLCELAPVRDPAGVDDAVAAVFSVTAQAGQGTREALVEFLHAKELLLVLDNCEHLLAGAAALAGVLQRSCERLVILATSREALGIEGERLVPVPPLGVPGAGADLAAITQADAVRLFAERAAAVKPGFQVTSQNAAAAAAVVQRLDGIALAVELAAARVPAMTPAELARRLERSFAVLAGGPRGAAEHHQTLRATIDWSFELLTEPEQQLLARLAVFAGGATLEAAEAVCGGEGIDPDAVFGLLASLVARSLVVAGEHGPRTRYRLLETIRQYGEQRLEAAGETRLWRDRHASYYASLLHQVRDHAHDPSQEVFWAVRLSAEQDNLLAAWSWVTGTGNVDTAFKILAGFAPLEVRSGYLLILPGEAALGLPGAAGHPGYPLALAVSAVFASNRADVTGAEELCRRASAANARTDAPDWRVEETICIARQNIATTRGAFGDAARLAEQAAGIARAGGDLADASLQLSAAAACHVLASAASAAVPLARDALGLARQTGAPALIATGLLAVGLAVAETDPGQARACLREGLELSTALDHHSAYDLLCATAIAFLIGDQAATLELGCRAIRGHQRGSSGLRMAFVFYIIAGTLAATRPEAAAIILGAAETYVGESPKSAQLISWIMTEALGEERARDLRGRGANMDWDQAVAYTLTQATQALSELRSATQP